MDSKNILISTLGTVPDIIEETIGFSNFSDNLDFYKESESYSKICESRNSIGFPQYKADELWLITTDKPHMSRNGKEYNSTLEDFEKIKDNCSEYVDKIRIFILQGISDISNETDANTFHDLTLRVVAFAKQQLNGGKLYLSLACGRKTMSADMQDAAYCFGCDALIHVLGDKKTDAYPLSLGNVTNNEALTDYEQQHFDNDDILYCKPQTYFSEHIQAQKDKSQHFYTTYYLNEHETRSNFHILYTLPPSKIKELKECKIGIDKTKKESELEFLKKLPKSDLHCHLGGVLSVAEMIDVAKCYIPNIEEEKKRNSKFRTWCEHIKDERNISSWKSWRKQKSAQLEVSEGLISSVFLLHYKNNISELDRIIFGNLICDNNFRAIGIERYESLGDLQGSALLCDEDAIRKTIKILLDNCRKDNIFYLELRCSPINYTTERLTAENVLQAILEELDNVPEIKSSILIIASRHSDMRKVAESIELVKKMKGDILFEKYFRGFDLAGAENAKSPKEMHDSFLDIMKGCLNITIHAGEGMPSQNIWEAIYYLNAERVGHGLTLLDNKDLTNKFLERGIGIEMCPSSNYQIVGFRDNYYSETSNLKTYPLKKYLDTELRVSINTDDPGISRTNATYELHRAARLTPNGLSKWDILQLICNGFRTAFFLMKGRKNL